MKLLPALACATAALLASAATSRAVLIYGLTTNNALVSFDSATPSQVTTIGTISQPGIVDIDFYPVNGLLYAFTGNGAGYRIDLTTAGATLVITPGSGLLGTVTDVDFNPAADRARLFTTGNQDAENFRMVPDVTTGSGNGTTPPPGTITADGNFSDANAQLVGSAYDNNTDGTTSTNLYSIDTTSNRLVLHSGGAALNTIGTVGTNLGIQNGVGMNVGFDIGQNGVAYLSDDQNLYTVNLNTGVATSIGTVGGTGLMSIAVTAVPEPSGFALAAFGLVGVFARRRRAA